jgi:hypothetical protein
LCWLWTIEMSAPALHEARVPWLERAVKRTSTLATVPRRRRENIKPRCENIKPRKEEENTRNEEFTCLGVN